MIIEFRCEREHARGWMKRGPVAVDGHDVPVQIAWTATAEPRPPGLEGLFELERMILRKGKPGGADRLKISPQESPLGEADIVVDFTGASRPARRDAICARCSTGWRGKTPRLRPSLPATFR